MDEAYGRTYYQWEGDHWWCRSRRELIVQLVRGESRDEPVLDVGCSGGALLADFRRAGFDDCTGVDISEEAVAHARRQGAGSVSVMNAAALDFPDSRFGVLSASDILEHIEDNRQALREWCRVLKPGGALILCVPAFMFLWSHHDEYNHHVRRYRRDGLLRRVREAGFLVERTSFWNFFLFGPATLTAAIQWLVPRTIRDYNVDSFRLARPLNAALLGLMRLENALLRLVDFPVGISLMVVARKEG